MYYGALFTGALVEGDMYAVCDQHRKRAGLFLEAPSRGTSHGQLHEPNPCFRSTAFLPGRRGPAAAFRRALGDLLLESLSGFPKLYEPNVVTIGPGCRYDWQYTLSFVRLEPDPSTHFSQLHKVNPPVYRTISLSTATADVNIVPVPVSLI